MVLACVCLSRSRRIAIKFAMATGLPMFGKVVKSPDASIPSSSSNTFVGNLNCDC